MIVKLVSEIRKKKPITKSHMKDWIWYSPNNSPIQWTFQQPTTNDPNMDGTWTWATTYVANNINYDN